MSYDLNIKSLKQEYLDIFEGVKSDIMYTAQYDNNRDIGIRYLGISWMGRLDELKEEY